MAATWGEAEVQVHVDGTALPREVREITSAAGKDGGETFGKAFKKSLRASMGDALNNMKASFGKQWEKTFIQGGRNAGKALTRGVKDGMKTFRLEFDKVSQQITRATESIDVGRWDSLGRSMRELGQAMPDVSNGFRQLAIEGGNGQDVFDPLLEDIGELRQVMDDSGDSARRTSGDFRILWRELEAGSGSVDKNTRNTHRMRDAWARIRGMWGGAGNALKRLGGAFDDFNNGPGARHRSMWKRLSANTRQWTLIIGAVIGAMGQLAGLAAAAGAGLFVLLGAFGSLLVGVVGFVAIFSALNQELEDAPEHMKPLIKEFQGFKKVIKQTGDEIASAAFAEMGGAFDSLSATVKGLNGPLRKVGTTLGRLFADFAKSVAPGTEAFGDLYTFIENSAGVLDRLIRAVGRFAGAIVKGFNKAMPLTEMMLGWIDKLVDNFTAFVEGPGFDEWIGHAMDVFGPFGDLLDTVGGLLNDMVTDETVGQLVDFIENIDRFLQGGGKGILDFAQELDIFGLVAKALADFGDALEPLAGPMADFADAINEVLQTGIESLAPVIEDIAKALAPFVQAVADFMSENPEMFANALLAIAAGFTAIKLVNIGATVVSGISSFVGLASMKNVSKLGKFAGAIAGVAVAWAGANQTAQAEGSGGEAAGGIIESILGGALSGAAIGSVVPVLGTAVGALVGALFGLISNAITSMFSDVDNVWKNGWSQIFDGSDFSGAGIGQVKEFFAGLPEAFTNGFEQIAGVWEGFITGFSEGWTAFWGSLGETIANWWTGIVEGWTNFWAMLNDPAFWDAIAVAIGEWIAGLIIAFTDWLAGVFEGWNTFWKTMNDPAFWNAIWDALAVWWQGIVDGFTGWWAGISQGWLDFWGSMNEPANWNAIWTAIAAWWQGILDGFGRWWSSITSGWNSFWGSLPQVVATAGNNIWNGLVGWWASIQSGFASFGADVAAGWNNFWGGLWKAVRDAVNRVLEWVNKLLGPIRDALGALGELIGAQAAGKGPGAAAGAVVAGPRRILVGEDGPEAIVPLRRSLGRVNPAVRGLSAIAQGKEYGGSPGVGLAGRVVNINEGAIVIQGARDPNADAVGVVNRIAERVAS